MHTLIMLKSKNGPPRPKTRGKSPEKSPTKNEHKTLVFGRGSRPKTRGKSPEKSPTKNEHKTLGKRPGMAGVFETSSREARATSFRFSSGFSRAYSQAFCGRSRRPHGALVISRGARLFWKYGRLVFVFPRAFPGPFPFCGGSRRPHGALLSPRGARLFLAKARATPVLMLLAWVMDPRGEASTYTLIVLGAFVRPRALQGSW